MNTKLVSLVAGLALSFTASAYDFKTLSLINGSDLTLADAAGVMSTTTGALYKQPNGNFGYANSYSNIVAGTVVVNSNRYVLPWVSYAEIFPQGDGTVQAGLALTVSTYVTNAASTNCMTIVIERSGDAVNWDERGTFSFNSPLGTVTTNTVQTNLPSAFMIGTRYIRIKQATNNTAAGSVGSMFLNKAYISGWSP